MATKGIDGWSTLSGANVIHKIFGLGIVKDINEDRFAADGLAILIKFEEKDATFQPGNFADDTFVSINFHPDFSHMYSDQKIQTINCELVSTELEIDKIESNENLGLSSSFYTRTTRSQEDLIRKLKCGLLVVEGTAGSGKTSVALGRMKALHDSRLGDENGVKDMFFDDKKSMIGFVRSPQLVEYLRSTIDDLNLSGMQVIEFDLVLHGLAVHRAALLQLKTDIHSKGVYRRIPPESRAIFEAKMSWIRDLTVLIEEFIASDIKFRYSNFVKKEYPSREFIRYVSFEGKTYTLPIQALWKSLTFEANILISELIDGFDNGGKTRWPSLGVIRKVAKCYEECCKIIAHSSIWYIDVTNSNITKKAYQGCLPEPIHDINRYGEKKSADQTALKSIRELKDLHEFFKNSLLRLFLLGVGKEGLLPITKYYEKSVGRLIDEGRYPVEKLNRIKFRLEATTLIPNDLTTMLVILEFLTKGGDFSNRDINKAFRRSEEHNYRAVFIDEVQDFTETEVFLMSRFADPERNAITAVGDFRQQLYPGTVTSLENCFPYATKNELVPIELLENKRQSPLLATFSSKYREFSAGTISSPPTPEKSGSELALEEIHPEQIPQRIGMLIAETDINMSVAVICPTPEVAEYLSRLSKPYVESYFRFVLYSIDNRDLIKTRYCHFTDSKSTKGLEFDMVIVPYIEQFEKETAIGRNALYVAVSRARSRLVQKWPREIGQPDKW